MKAQSDGSSDNRRVRATPSAVVPRGISFERRTMLKHRDCNDGVAPYRFVPLNRSILAQARPWVRARTRCDSTRP
jgi:hypothetical protein